MPGGLDPGVVAVTICDAIVGVATDLPSATFGKS